MDIWEITVVLGFVSVTAEAGTLSCLALLFRGSNEQARKKENNRSLLGQTSLGSAKIIKKFITTCKPEPGQTKQITFLGSASTCEMAGNERWWIVVEILI